MIAADARPAPAGCEAAASSMPPGAVAHAPRAAFVRCSARRGDLRGRQRRGDAAGEPARRASADRAADRGAARRPALACGRRRARVHRRRVRRGRLPHAHGGPAAAAAAARRRPARARSAAATVAATLGHPRLVAPAVRRHRRTRSGPASRAHGRPIQYAHVREPLALWDVWTPIAGAAGRVRAAVGRLRAGLGDARARCGARRRVRDA